MSSSDSAPARSVAAPPAASGRRVSRFLGGTLAFRGQALDDAAHTRFASHFGELTTAHPTVPSVDDNEHILAVEGGEGAPTAGTPT